MSSWYDTARRVLRELDAELPADMPFDERAKACKEAYPFGERRYTPYKMWLKAQKEYLLKYAPPSMDTKRFPLSPLERLVRKGKRLEGNEA